MNFEVIPLTASIGSEIRSSAEEIVSPQGAAKLREVLIERGIVVVRGIGLTDDQQLALSSHMGTVRDEGERGVMKITMDKNENAAAEYLRGSWLWHLDGTHDDVPIFASLLSGRVLSQVGGQTEFANTHAAYDALPDEMKARIEGLKVAHSIGVSMRRAGVEASPENEARWRMAPDKIHNLVWTHKSGRKSLVIGCHASHVIGMDREESDALLEELLAWTTQPRFVYRHEWTLGDLVIWDNTGVLHRAEPYPIDSGRMMHRTTLLGEEAFA